MKIALLGSAGSSVGRAPFKNERYAAWVEGKLPDIARAHDFVPGNFQIWGCSPGCWAVVPRATRWFEVHRWENDVAWFTPAYRDFLRNFKGPVYTGGRIPEIQNHVIFPLDRMEAKFASYGFTSSLGLMLALAIDEIEQVRENRRRVKEGEPTVAINNGGAEPEEAEYQKDDNDDVIGLWGVDMSASEEYAYQRPGCQWMILEAMRRGIGVYLPGESDLMRPMPVYGISEWDHSYIKLTVRARELSHKVGQMQQQMKEAETTILGVQGEQSALQYFVSTWTSPYGMLPGMVIRQAPGTGLGSGITAYDGRPVERMQLAPPPVAHAPVLQAMTESPDAVLGRELVALLDQFSGAAGKTEGAVEVLKRIIREREAVMKAVTADRPLKGKKRRR